MRRPLPIYLLLFALAAVATASPDPEREGIWEWSGVPKVVAIGDLHGSYDKFVRLVEGAGLVDDELRWVGGENHLVVAGDFLDRGNGGRELMDLLRRLQAEAKAAGGRVHVLLGNHEAMNLMRDTRYVSRAAFRDFAREEDPGQREAAWMRFFRARVSSAGLAEVRDEFQRRFPEGFFGRQKLFDLDGNYGEWLRTLPAIVKIDGVLYLHGGLTADVAALGIDGINRSIHQELRQHLELRSQLQAAGVVTPEMSLPEILNAAATETERRRSAMAKTAAAFLDVTESSLLGSRGPLWYRGNSLEDERIERTVLDRSLELLDAHRMVVAHTHTGGDRITSRFHGKLYRVDHGIAQSQRPMALIVERDEPRVLDTANGVTLWPVPELPTGESPQAATVDLDDDRKRALLRSGPVTFSVDLGRGSSRPRLVVLERNGSRARAVFKTIQRPGEEPSADRYQHEIAAYAVDEMLGLGLVPLTLARAIEGEEGSLQAWVEGAVDQAAAAEYGLDVSESETMRRQLASARLFDALIGNYDRKPADILFRLGEDRVFLIDHSKAFSTATEVDCRPEAEAPDPALLTRLGGLDRDALESALGELLVAEQIDAILARRDRILAVLGGEAEPSPVKAVVASD